MYPYLTPGWTLGTSSISDSKPVQWDCWGKSTITSFPLALKAKIKHLALLVQTTAASANSVVFIQIINRVQIEQFKGYREQITFHHPNAPVSDRAPFVLWCGDCWFHPHFVTNLYMGGRTLWWESWKNNNDKVYSWRTFYTRDISHSALQYNIKMQHIKTRANRQ